MLKYFLIFLTAALFTNAAECQKKGTFVFYLKNTKASPDRVSTRDSCDFFRVILPPDSGEKLLNVKEYYQDGKLKLVGKTKSSSLNKETGSIRLEGEAISFHPSGKRESIANYVDNGLVGLKIDYYPNGKLFCTTNYLPVHYIFSGHPYLLWECYDKEGAMICENGNGRWIRYNDDFTEILEQGAVKNGRMEGEWGGVTHFHDHLEYTFKYVSTYKNGVFKSGTGYDKAGNAYPFTMFQEIPAYKNNFFDFFDDIKKHLKIPRDADGGRMSIDTIRISFIIEKDGHLTHCETIGDVDPKLSTAIIDALSQCKGWSSRKFFGVPFRSKYTVPIRYMVTTNIRADIKTFDYVENILED